ncbi:TPA: hypothetical protein F3L15_09535 [Aeromonas hydrophila]|uniref:hypothetical protein n=1 Tax=Aeromonas hydrophila TaxID=644 RepID=UPI00118585FC|nr:hypothetical protein [Aeromonas hydrophila]HAU4884258.1 hypothetical protein [Aeromonas hydrophila]
MMKWLTAFALVTTGSLAQAGEVKVHNIEYPSRMYGEYRAVITVESDKSKVECVAYRDGVPVGSGSGYTTAGIANVDISVTKKEGAFTVKCS